MLPGDHWKITSAHLNQKTVVYSLDSSIYIEPI